MDPHADHPRDPRRLHRRSAARPDPRAREKEFIEASISQGASAWRVMLAELLPNIASTILVFTLIIANNILVEAALSFLRRVQPPNPSWGTLDLRGQLRSGRRRG